MSRPIKFRAWDEKRKLMVREFSLTTDGTALTPHTGLGYEGLHETQLHLMQFTGITDKNGKDVYEGDLMLTDDMYHDYQDGVAINALPDGKIVPVEFRDGAFFAGDELLCEFASAWESIGNIYENPGLLSV